MPAPYGKERIYVAKTDVVNPDSIERSGTVRRVTAGCDNYDLVPEANESLGQGLHHSLDAAEAHGCIERVDEKRLHERAR